MKPGACLINVGRGPLVDEPALAAALREKKIGGGALDVFPKEPLPADSPLWDVPNLLITPHTAALTTSYGSATTLCSPRICTAIWTASRCWR